jgi:hypothetical protein
VALRLRLAALSFLGTIGSVVVAQTAPTFRDRTAELGLELANEAACWADLNNDGWTDLCAGGVVWLNQEGQRFARLADGFGPVVAADFDNDGFVDLFSWGALRVFRNAGGQGFEPLALPELPKCVSRGACWGASTVTALWTSTWEAMRTGTQGSRIPT